MLWAIWQRELGWFFTGVVDPSCGGVRGDVAGAWGNYQ